MKNEKQGELFWPLNWWEVQAFVRQRLRLLQCFPDHAKAWSSLAIFWRLGHLNHTNLQQMICKSSSAIVSTVMVANRGEGFDQTRLDYGVDRC